MTTTKEELQKPEDYIYEFIGIELTIKIMDEEWNVKDETNIGRNIGLPCSLTEFLERNKDFVEKNVERMAYHGIKNLTERQKDDNIRR